MKRLLRIGGLLILVSLALAIMLRILLVPSGAPSDSKAAPSRSATTSAPSTATAPPTNTDAPPKAETTTPRAGNTASAEEYFQQALSDLDTGRLKEARAAFQKVLELEPDNARAKTRLSLLEEEISKKAERHFNDARQAFQYLRYQEAIAEWEMFLTLADSSDVRYAEAQQGIQQAKAKVK